MFGIGFFELLVIAVLGLLVFGPEKLPDAIRTLAFGFSKARRSWQNTRRELEQELGMDEIRREIHNAQVLENIEKVKAAGSQTQQDLNNNILGPDNSDQNATEAQPTAEPAAPDQPVEASDHQKS